LFALARTLTQQLTGECWAVEDPRLITHFTRLQQCVLSHQQLWASDGCLAVSQVVERLQGRSDEDPGNLLTQSRLREVCLAQALEDREERATELFLREYLPPLHRLARQIGGEAAVELADSLPAELILPRPPHPPRIAGYRGRAPLLMWLRAVLANLWTTRGRRQQFEPLGSRDWADHRGPLRESSPCGELLREPLRRVLTHLHPEQRLILSLLIVHGVPQKAVAQSLGIHSGTLTRRRQQAVEQILAGLREEVLRQPQLAGLRDCLEAILAGDDPEARAMLSEVLTSGIVGSLSQPTIVPSTSPGSSTHDPQ
jgi:DNA-directed RNA polymerase specialized sigma24 family protein